jgi:hypothetical protein
VKRTGIAGYAVSACCAFVAAALSAGCGGKPPQREAGGPSDGPAEAKEPAKRKDAGPDPQRLVGEWVRPDGGYVIKITRVASDGVVDASYHNPSPIKVERARATTEDGKLKLHLKLNDRGYPGCVYELEYDRENDVMVGTYFQAAMRQTYRIGFQRMR